jgi:hypothetical protein
MSQTRSHPERCPADFRNAAPPSDVNDTRGYDPERYQQSRSPAPLPHRGGGPPAAQAEGEHLLARPCSLTPSAS